MQASSGTALAFNQQAPRDVAVRIKYLIAPTSPEPEPGEPSPLARVRAAMPVHLQALRELDGLKPSDAFIDTYKRVKENLRSQFWRDVFGEHPIREQFFQHEVSDSVPLDFVQAAVKAWTQKKAELAEDVEMDASVNQEALDDYAAKLVMERIVGNKPGMLRINFLDALAAGHDLDVLIDETIPFPRTRNLLHHFTRLNAVPVGAQIVHNPSWERSQGDIRYASEVSIDSTLQ